MKRLFLILWLAASTASMASIVRWDNGEVITDLNLSVAASMGLDLSYADLSNQTIQALIFNQSNLSHAKLDNCLIRWCTFNGVIMDGANLSGAWVESNSMVNLQAVGADFTSATVRWGNLSNANLAGITAPGSEWNSISMTGCNISGADFSNALIHDLSLAGCDGHDLQAPGLVVYSTALSNANFRWADFEGASIRNGSAAGSDFREASFQAATFASVGYGGADFRGATYSMESNFPAWFSYDDEGMLLAGSSAEATEEELSFQLTGAYPNPFNPNSRIEYVLEEAGLVQLSIHDLSGAQVAVLADEMQAAGVHTFNFNASGLPSGVYFARLSQGSMNSVIRMTLLK